MISNVLDHIRLLSASGVELPHADAPPFPPQIGIASRMSAVAAAGKCIIIGTVAAEIDQILDHEGGATMENRVYAIEVASVELDHTQCRKYFCRTFQTADQIGPRVFGPPPPRVALS